MDEKSLWEQIQIVDANISSHNREVRLLERQRKKLVRQYRKRIGARKTPSVQIFDIQ